MATCNMGKTYGFRSKAIWLFLLSLAFPSGFLSAQSKSLRLTFAGDLMAHTPNFSIRPYEAIYEDISYLLKTDDLSFVNLEFPIDDSKPYKSYPAFNVHSEYPLVAVQAGFDVFSLANNHSADNGAAGIPITEDAMVKLKKWTFTEMNRSIWFNGLRAAQKSAPYTLTVVEKGGLRIGFVAIAEWLNIPSLRQWVQFADFREQPAPENFLVWLKKIRPRVDVLILSYHWGEEYVNYQSKARAGFSKLLVEAGVDILWGNHPHVLQPWYTLETSRGTALVMPSCGNFISGQTWHLGPGDSMKTDAPKGDSMLMGVTISVTGSGKISFDEIDPILIAAWKNANGQMVVRTLAELVRNSNDPWRQFFRKRLENMSSLIPRSLVPSAQFGLPEPIPERNIPE